MKKSYLLLLMLCVCIFHSSFSQTQKYDLKGRYLVIEDFQKFFQHENGIVKCDKFFILNFKDGLSAKNEHVVINNIEGVVRFGIATGSEEYENTRRCYIKMNESMYISTFFKVLRKLNVDNVVVDEEIIAIDNFLRYSKTYK